ncbi:hypothetical protein D3OALGB2SA_53, partial [Olavius algarvensis associated proteobacterium Delta 3]
MLQLRVVDPPAMIASGSALMLAVGTGCTVTVTSALAVPPGPVAVIAYIVVAEGDTSMEPL